MKEIDIFMVGEENLKDLPLDKKKEVMPEIFFSLAKEIGLSYDQLGEMIESLFYGYQLSKKLSGSMAEKIIEDLMKKGVKKNVS